MAYRTRADAQKEDLAARSAQRSAEESRDELHHETSMARLMDLYHDQAIRIDWKRAVVGEIIRSLQEELCRRDGYEEHEGHHRCLAALSVIRNLQRLFDDLPRPK
jgi:hypothetical protein